MPAGGPEGSAAKSVRRVWLSQAGALPPASGSPGKALRYALAAIALTLPAAAFARPGEVNAHEFYVAAQGLLAKGPAAVFDSRREPLTAQFRDAVETVRAENAAAGGRGRGLYCIPEEERREGMSVRFIMDQLAAIPEPERRTMTLRSAWRRILMRNYPCR